jgi:hypothetical protein
MASGRRARRLVVLAALPTAITVAAEWSGLATWSNPIRALAGMPLGAAVGFVVVAAVGGLLD